MSNLIETCCICGNKAETKKVLPYRDLMGSGVDVYEMHIAHCDNCGFVFIQNPFTPEQLENRYKNDSKCEFDAIEHIANGNDDYIGRCNRQKHFIEENLASERHSRGGAPVQQHFGSWRGVRL